MEFSIERLWNGEVCSDTPIHFQLKSKSIHYFTMFDNHLKILFQQVKEYETFLVIFNHCGAKRALYNVSGFCRSCWE